MMFFFLFYLIDSTIFFCKLWRPCSELDMLLYISISVPPVIYKKVKQVPENKREGQLIKELEEILSREGLSSNPSEKGELMFITIPSSLDISCNISSWLNKICIHLSRHLLDFFVNYRRNTDRNIIISNYHPRQRSRFIKRNPWKKITSLHKLY